MPTSRYAPILRGSPSVWLGHEGLAAALGDGSVELEGPRDVVSLVRRLLDLRDTPAAKVFRFVPPEASALQAAAGAST